MNDVTTVGSLKFNINQGFRLSLCNYTWEIKNFNEYETGRMIASPIFSTRTSNTSINWRMMCCLSWTGMSYAQIHLQNLSDARVLADYQLELVKSNALGNESLRYAFAPRKSEPLSKSECKIEAISRSYFIDTRRGVNIEISCTIFKLTLADPQPNISLSTGLQDWTTCKDNYRIREFDDFEKLLDDKESSDVTFDVSGKQISLHKAILRARSPVFQAMFQHDMKERKENLVTIDDARYDVMMEVFRFIYTGKVNGINDKVKDLYVAADKYSITGLQTLCEKILYDSLNVENSVDYLNFTVSIGNADALKAHIIEFVLDNLDEISSKPDFKMLDSNVMYDIIRGVAKRKNE